MVVSLYNVARMCQPTQPGVYRTHALLVTLTVAPYGSSIIVVVFLTLTRIIKSVVTGQAPVTLELRNTPGKTRTTQGGTRIYMYITADAIHASTRNI